MKFEGIGKGSMGLRSSWNGENTMVDTLLVVDFENNVGSFPCGRVKGVDPREPDGVKQTACGRYVVEELCVGCAKPRGYPRSE